MSETQTPPSRAQAPASDVAAEDRAAALDNTGLPALSDHMTMLRTMMDYEYERLRAEWAALLAEKDAIDRIKDRIQSVTVGEHDRLRLNVSGQRFEIRATSVQKNTYFRSLLSNTFAPADADGFYYIDRDPKFVMVILNMMRSGDVDLDEFNERQLKQIRDDADFYMVGDLITKVDRVLAQRRSGTGIAALSLNRDVPTTLSFHGVFFEFSVTKRNLALHSISFVPGESRHMLAEAFLVEAGLDGAKPQKVGDVEIDATKGEPVTISFSAVALTGTTYTVGVYSSTCPTAIVACPTTMATRDFSKHGLVVERTYHTTNSRFWTRRANEDEYDFVGELGVSS